MSFFILDRTLAVWESRRNNSGREGGVFLERTRVPDPETGQAFTENDMQVGSPPRTPSGWWVWYDTTTGRGPLKQVTRSGCRGTGSPCIHPSELIIQNSRLPLSNLPPWTYP